MSQWDPIYERLESDGTLQRREQQREGTAWIEEFLPLLGEPAGESLDLGCGMGSDMLRYRELGWRPIGVDLSEKAVEHVQRLGLPARVADIRDPLPFGSGRFNLVTARCSMHFFPVDQTQALFDEIHRVLAPGGKLLFIVNSEEHRAQGLQYDYGGAKQLERNYWELPSLDRRYLFYTLELTEQLLGSGWLILHLEERPFRHWETEKRVVICISERTAAA